MPETDLVRVLNSVGKSTFIQYYQPFSDFTLSNQDVVSLLPSDYTLKSRNSRTSKARKIIREGLAEDALTIIANSNHVDADTATRARQLLSNPLVSSETPRQNNRRSHNLSEHKWSDDDNLIVYCLYRMGCNEHVFGIEPTELGEILGMGINSINYKIANFKYIDGLGGMEGFSQQAARIHKKYCLMPDTDLREVGIEAVAEALNKFTNGA